MLGMRVVREAQVGYLSDSITKSSQVAELVSYLRGEVQEHLVVFPVNAQHKVLGKFTVGIGTVNRCQAPPADILRPAVVLGAYGIFLAHNHPSGEAEPSAQDHRFTSMVLYASMLMGIKLIDHVIVGEGYYSYADAGRLQSELYEDNSAGLYRAAMGK